MLVDRVNPPEMKENLSFYLRAFHRLSHERHYGAWGGVTSIYYTAISTYARDFGITGSQFEIFLRVIDALDRVYIESLPKPPPPGPEGNK